METAITPSLVRLNAEHSQIVAQLIDEGGELTPEREALLEDLQLALCRKTDAYGVVMAQLEAKAQFWKDQEEQCARAKRAAQNAADSLKARMKFVLSQTEGQELQGSLYRFFLARSKDKLCIDDEGSIPAEFKRSELLVSVDKKAVEAALAKGLQVSGARLEPVQALRKGSPK